MYATTIIGILFAIHVLLVLTIFGAFAYAVTHPKRITLGFEISLASWIIFLSVLAVVFHTITYVKLPWVRWEVLEEWKGLDKLGVLGKKLVPEKEISIDIKDGKFYLPENPITTKVNKPVRFIVSSSDVTYGFGVFRSNGTMVFQMQVVPQHANKIIWVFHEAGKYTIRSTEYSGPEGWKMVLRDAIIVSDEG